MIERPILVMDLEVYRNYFLCKFYDPSLEGIQCCKFELFEGTTLNRLEICDILSKYTIITFNGIGFDEPILTYALAGATCSQIKEASDLIIKGGLKYWDFYRNFNLQQLHYIDHIDISNVLKGVGVSLKKYAARSHAKKLQELPVHEAAILTSEQMTLIDHPYCTNDLVTTYQQYLNCKPAIDLRKEISDVYRVDLRSKSDAQMAEAIIKVQLGFKPEKPNWYPGSTIKYIAPNFIRSSPILDLLQNARFTVTDKDIEIPEEIKSHVITIGTTNYKLGIGGLHSMEESVHYEENDNLEIIDADVTSYYPSLILLCKMYPKQIGERFLEIYEKIYKERLSAKKNGDKLMSECFKIVLNGSYGKLGSKYSIIYAPDLMLKVTLTGQLAILMLIQMLEDADIKVVSANTDGIVILCQKSHKLIQEQIIHYWETLTGLKMEYSKYSKLYSRDVNNYIAIKQDGNIKLKGAFAEPSTEKDPHNHVCIQAVINYLKDGKSIEDTINTCQDLREFISVRYCKEGAVFIGKKELPPHETKEELIKLAGFEIVPLIHPKVRYFRENISKEHTLAAAYKLAVEELQCDKPSEILGKVVRFYIAKGEKGNLAYSGSGNKIADSLGARPIMDLPDILPKDIDRNYYVQESYKILDTLVKSSNMQT